MTVYIDSSVYNMPAGPGGSGTTPADQVQAAVTIWNNFFSTNEGNSTNFTIQVVSSSDQANVTINAADLSATHPNAGAFQPTQSGKISSQTITLNTTGVLKNTNTPILDPTQSGYQNVITKIILHELGHVFGLADVYNSCSTQAYMSVMDQLCGVNDSAQSIPLNLTSCDQQEVKATEPGAVSCLGVSCGCPGGGAGCCKNPTCCAATSVVSATINPGDAKEIGRHIGGTPVGQYSPIVSATNTAPQDRCTPILLDLSGKGFKLTDTSGGVDFDFFGSGNKIRIPWTARDSRNAWLVLDRNGNGTIDDSSEMFGNMTPQPPSDNPNGFTALAQYDRPENGGNGDGIIDSRDKIFAQLRLWVDKNHNGISEPGELIGLSQAGIEALDLTYSETHVTDPNGNVFRLRSVVKVRPESKDSNNDFDVILVNTQ